MGDRFEPEWYTEDFRELVGKVLEAKGKPERVRLVRNLRKLRKRLKSTFYGERAKMINMASIERDTAEVFRLSKSKMVKKSSSTKCHPDALHKHFERHFASRNLPLPEELQNPANFPELWPQISPINDEKPTMAEISQALSKLKCGKAEGTDFLTGEQLKYQKSSKLIRQLHALFAEAWKLAPIPESWKLGRIESLFKNKGSAQDPAMYRGLSINSTANKVLIMIWLSRLRASYESTIMECQYGFRSGRSTSDAVMVARNLGFKIGEDFVGSFIDLRAAYDHLDRPMTFKILKKRTGGSHLIAVLEWLYNGQKAFISEKGPDDPF